MSWWNSSNRVPGVKPRKTWKHWVAEIGAAVVIASAAIYLADNLKQSIRAGVSSSAWFQINDIYVPNFHSGDNPEVTYDRVIREPFRGFWVVEMQRQTETGAFSLECTGSGVNDYEPADYIPNNLVRLEWFVGKECRNVPVGTYRIRASWVMRRPDWPQKTAVEYSNMFQVLP